MRFNYSDRWTEKSLQNICEFYKGNGISKEDISENGNPCILYGQLYTTYKNEIIHEVISKTNAKLKNPFYSKINDLIIPSSGEDPLDIAVARSVKQENVLLGGDLNILRPNKLISSDFLSYQLNGVRKYDIAKIAQGKSIVHLHNEDLKKIKVYIPSIQEQMKISSLLNLLDLRIDTQIKIINENESYINALKEQMLIKFSNNITFSVGEVCSITTGKLDANAMKENGKYRFYTCAEKYYYIDEYAFDTEALLISGNGANVGYIHYYNGKFNAYQRTYILSNFKINPLTLKLNLDVNLKKRIEEQKNTGNTPYIKLDTISKMKLYLINKDDEDKVLQIINSIEHKIENEKKILELLIKQKSYFLANLFI